MVKRGRNLVFGALISLASMRILSFSEKISGVETAGDEANGLSVRIGMILVLWG